MMNRIVVTLISVLAIALPAKAQRADSLGICHSEEFRVTQLIAPAVLIAGGTFATYNPWFRSNVNEPVRDYVLEKGFSRSYVDYLMSGLAPAAYLGIGWTWLQHSHSGKERAAVLATATAIQCAMEYGIKFSTKIMRPDNSTATSFPSQHTAFAFMGAELMRIEYGPWWGIGAYSLAAATAIMRIYNNRHWVSDLIGGAGVGILSAQAAYWLLSLERRLFNWDSECTAALVPYAAPGTAGMALSIVF